MTKVHETAPKWGYDTRRNQIFRDKCGQRIYYSVREKIAEGYCSNVHVLRADRQGLKDKVIKIAKRGCEHKLTREVQMLSALEHGIKPKYALHGYTVFSKFDNNLVRFLPRLDVKLQNSAIDQLLKAVHLLHKKNILHSDISISNVLCKERKNGILCILSDFGDSRIITGNKVTDIQALGVLIRSIILRTPLFPYLIPQLRPLRETDIPKGIDPSLASLTNSMIGGQMQSMDRVMACYSEHLHQEKFHFFKF